MFSTADEWGSMRAGSRGPNSAPSTGKRILVVDDHPVIRAGLRGLIDDDGTHTVAGEAADGRTALARARTLQPDIAIVDCSLPLLNGIDLARMLRLDLPELEVLMFTVHDRGEIVQEALEAGVRGFILKSDPEIELLAALNALARRRPYFSGFVAGLLLHESLGHTVSPDRLSSRQRELLQLIAEGKTNKEAARILGTSIKTIETHRAAMMEKLGGGSLADVVRFAVRNHIIDP